MALTETDTELNLLKHQQNELIMQNKAIPQVSAVSSPLVNRVTVTNGG